MTEDVFWNFYVTSLRSQYFAQLNLSDAASESLQLRTQMLRDLGSAVKDLLDAALPSRLRNPRSFRIKYIDDLDLSILEICLISAANRTITEFNRDPTVASNVPAAQEVMNCLSTLQVLVFAAADAAQEEIQGSTDLSVQQVLMQHISSTASQCVRDLRADQLPGRNPGNTQAACRSALKLLRKYVPPTNRAFMDRMVISRELLDHLHQLDEALVEFELRFIGTISRRLRTRREAEDLQLVSVLFSETLMWAMAVGVVTAEALADRDPVILLGLPRLAVLVGCLILPGSPIGPERLLSGRRVPFMFHNCLTDLTLLCRQLTALRPDQLWLLVRWLGPSGLPHSVSQPALSNPAEASSSSKNLETARSNNLPGLHWLYKRISAVADTVSGNHSTELRYVLQKAIEINEIDCEVSEHAPAEPEEMPVERSKLDEVEELPDEEVKHFFDWVDIVTGTHTRSPKQLQIVRKCSPKDAVEESEVAVDVLSWLESSVENVSIQHDHSTQPEVMEERTEHVDPEATVAVSEGRVVESSPAPPQSHCFPPWQPDLGVRDRDGRRVDTADEEADSDSYSDDQLQELESSSEVDDARRRGRLPMQGSVCAHCLARFGLWRRKHHCRRCGHIFCHPCSPYVRVLEGLGTIAQRICVDCTTFLGGPDS